MLTTLDSLRPTLHSSFLFEWLHWSLIHYSVTKLKSIMIQTHSNIFQNPSLPLLSIFPINFYTPNVIAILKLIFNFAFDLSSILFLFFVFLALKDYSLAKNIWLPTYYRKTKYFLLGPAFMTSQNLHISCLSRHEGAIFLQNILLQSMCFIHWRIILRNITSSGVSNNNVKKLMCQNSTGSLSNWAGFF